MPIGNDFNWRPNDRSATTMLRYKVESKRWLEGFTSAASSSRTNDPFIPFIVLSQIVTLCASIVMLVLLGIWHLLMFIVGSSSKEDEGSKLTRKSFEEDYEPIFYDPIPDSDPDKEEKEYYRRVAQEMEKKRVEQVRQIL